VGGARTALFNWLFARKEGGTFLLRIEDTDEERSSEEMTTAILDALDWLGLDVDEGPLHQADGLERHRDDVARLLESGAAYRCFCGPDAVGEEGAEAVGGCPSGCRELPDEEAARRAADGEPHAVRFRVPPGETAWRDAVHGRISFPNDDIEDFVLLRSDGTPVYNLAVVSDDVAMGITHVVRGDDHLSNTPKQILIYDALGEELPVFAHVPMILGPDGQRLSKRHGAASVQAFRDEGILPEAMVNFLALLGWSPGDEREVMGRDELIEAFGLERVLKKSGVFDRDKLEWMNGQHISRSSAERLADPVLDVLAEDHGLDPRRVLREKDRFLEIVDEVKDRPRTVRALASQVAPYFVDRVAYENEAVERFWDDPEAAAGRLEALGKRFRGVGAWEPEELEEELRALADERGEGAGDLIHPLRVALTGQAVTPGIFTVLHLMGRQRTLRRIEDAVERLRSGTAAG
jgi:glutamyl-tRNA synthetase